MFSLQGTHQRAKNARFLVARAILNWFKSQGYYEKTELCQKFRGIFVGAIPCGRPIIEIIFFGHP